MIASIVFAENFLPVIPKRRSNPMLSSFRSMFLDSLLIITDQIHAIHIIASFVDVVNIMNSDVNLVKSNRGKLRGLSLYLCYAPFSKGVSMLTGWGSGAPSSTLR